MDQLLSGMIAMGFAVAGVFFLRFWRDTRDRLFAMFALSFLVMAGSRIAVALSDQPAAGTVQYWVRFVAFGLILFAVLDKNRPPRAAPPPSPPA
ncbi:DUF5985 family protein [Gemmata sp.]|uniref:DUF5985 family protein n=1 Tax=Gemmata sp. TaxID=1914242 RepID=UPI003F705CD6